MKEPTEKHRRIIDSLADDVAPTSDVAPPRSYSKEYVHDPNRRESAVYFVAVRGFIKIGWTENWVSRISTLQTANPEPLEILLILGRPMIFEKTMHRKFAAHKAVGEWFHDCPEIREYIENRQEECWYLAGRRK